jgi:hypothetical protein
MMRICKVLRLYEIFHSLIEILSHDYDMASIIPHINNDDDDYDASSSIPPHLTTTTTL